MALLRAPWGTGRTGAGLPGLLPSSKTQAEALVWAPDAKEKRFILASSQLFHTLSADRWMPPVRSQATESSRDGSAVLAKADGGRGKWAADAPSRPCVMRGVSSWTGGSRHLWGQQWTRGWGHPTPSLPCWCYGGCMHHG